jgi:hypothetical protein
LRPNSGVVVLPTRIAPAALSRATEPKVVRPPGGVDRVVDRERHPVKRVKRLAMHYRRLEVFT